MKIPTANVVIGFKREVMERFFTQGATYQSLIQGLSVSGEDTLLFENESNPNFISFEHSLNFGGGWRMQLVFIDPKGEFESRYISDNIARNIAGFSYNDSQNYEKDTFQAKINKAMIKSQEGYGEAYFSDLQREYRKLL
jgi:hypothetical protein